MRADTVDGLWSYCRIFETGPPCPHLCGSCKRADRLLQQLPDTQSLEFQPLEDLADQTSTEAGA
jgi:hypothetical protein